MPVRSEPAESSSAVVTTAPDELLDALLKVFSARGFDGASLAELARVSNRSKASLYHHFPGGKTQMIDVLIQRCQAALDAQAFDLLRQTVARGITNKPVDPKDKTADTNKHKRKTAAAGKAGAKNKQAGKQRQQEQAAARQAIENFVDGFRNYLSQHNGNCLLATLALTQPELLGDNQRDALADWLALLAASCELTGRKPKAARRQAQASLARLYGSLTLAAMGSHVSLDQACKWLKRDLLRT